MTDLILPIGLPLPTTHVPRRNGFQIRVQRTESSRLCYCFLRLLEFPSRYLFEIEQRCFE